MGRSNYPNAFIFEHDMQKVAREVLSPYGSVQCNHRIQSGHAFNELDLVFAPSRNHLSRTAIFIFEFKYADTPTLSDSTLFVQLARFEAFKKANETLSMVQILVTNGFVQNLPQPNGIHILSDIETNDIWRTKLLNFIKSTNKNIRL